MSTPTRKVIATPRFFDENARAFLRSKGCDIRVMEWPGGATDAALTHSQLIELARDAAGWIVGHARITRELLLELPDLKIIARRGVGYDGIDFEAARDLNRVVTITAGGNESAVADHAIGLMLAVGRRTTELHRDLRLGSWAMKLGTDLNHKTVGLVGLGRIGRRVVQRLKGFDCRVLVHTTHPDHAFGEAAGVEFVELDELLGASDVVSLHAPLTERTRFLINQATIARMKPSAIVINTARGGLIEDAHLLHALREGRLAGAGLDVFMSEADPAYSSITAQLVSLPNVVATPHVGASTIEALMLANRIASECVVAVLDGEDPPESCIIADGRMDATSQES